MMILILMMVIVFQGLQASEYLSHDQIQKSFVDKKFSGNRTSDHFPLMARESLPPHSEKSFVIPNDVRPEVDLRFRDTPSKTQFGGTCSTFGLIAAMENTLYAEMPIDLSERHLWSKYRKYSSERAIETALNEGPIVEEEFWPMNRKFPKRGYKHHARARLLEAPYLEGRLDLAIKALNADHPVYLGISVTNSLYACDKVVDPHSPTNGGGHAVSVVGYKLDKSVEGGGYLIVKNSWSATCGDSGYQYVPFSYCTRSDMYCIMWEIKKVSME